MQRLSRLWKTWTSLRTLDTKGPEMLRSAAARDTAAVERMEQQMQERQRVTSELAGKLSAKVEALSAQLDARREARAAQARAQLDQISIDPAAVQANAVHDLMGKWESTLSAAGGSSGGGGGGGGGGDAPVPAAPGAAPGKKAR
jgi:hypothetical protein